VVLSGGSLFPFVDGDGDSVTAQLQGAGSVSLDFAIGSSGDIVSATFSSATSSTTFTLDVTATSGNGMAVIGSLIATGQTLGAVQVEGALGGVTAGDIRTLELVTLGTVKGNLGTIGDVRYTGTFSSGDIIRTTGGLGSIRSVRVDGDFAGKIETKGNANTLGDVIVGGTGGIVAGSTISTIGSSGQLIGVIRTTNGAPIAGAIDIGGDIISVGTYGVPIGVWASGMLTGSVRVHGNVYGSNQVFEFKGTGGSGTVSTRIYDAAIASGQKMSVNIIIDGNLYGDIISGRLMPPPYNTFPDLNPMADGLKGITIGGSIASSGAIQAYGELGGSIYVGGSVGGTIMNVGGGSGNKPVSATITVAGDFSGKILAGDTVVQVCGTSGSSIGNFTGQLYSKTGLAEANDSFTGQHITSIEVGTFTGEGVVSASSTIGAAITSLKVTQDFYGSSQSVIQGKLTYLNVGRDWLGGELAVNGNIGDVVIGRDMAGILRAAMGNFVGNVSIGRSLLSSGWLIADTGMFASSSKVSIGGGRVVGATSGFYSSGVYAGGISAGAGFGASASREASIVVPYGGMEATGKLLSGTSGNFSGRLVVRDGIAGVIDIRRDLLRLYGNTDSGLIEAGLDISGLISVVGSSTGGFIQGGCVLDWGGIIVG
jgi:hypothetical protein